MASTHKHLRSSTANKRPTTAIADGQIALNTNTTSPGLFFKDSTGATIIKVGPVHVGTTAPNASPAAGGSAGNSIGEIWLDTSLTPVGVKIWNGSAFVNATPVGSTTVQGLLELATNAETQTGTDPDRAVTPAGLQSKVSDSTSTTSSTTIASSTAVKSAYDLANAALPKTGGTVTGNLEIGTTGSLSFEGATADAFETTIAVVDPTADRTITLPDQTGNVLVSGNASIVNADVNASAAIAGTKISPDFGSQNRTSTGTSTAASFIPSSSTAPTNGVYLPAANTVGISTNGSGRLFVDASGRLGVGTSSPGQALQVVGSIGVNTGTAASTNGSGISIYDASFPRLTFRNSTTGDTTGDGTQLVQDGLNFNIGNTEAGEIKFFTSNTQRATIDSSGRVGIGVTGPDASLTIASGASLTNYWTPAGLYSAKLGTVGSGQNIYAGITGTYQAGDSANLLLQARFSDVGTVNGVVLKNSATNAGGLAICSLTAANGGAVETERARIDSSGRLLVGTSSARTSASHTGSLQLEGTSFSASTFSIISNANDSTGSYIHLGKARGGSIGSTTIAQSGDTLGQIHFTGSDGTNLINGAFISAVVDGTPGTNDMPGRLVFSTTEDGASSPTERMRIANDGSITSTIAATNTANNIFNATSTSYISTQISINNYTAAGTGFNFLQCWSGNFSSERLKIIGNGNVQNANGSYTTLSDAKLKENIVDASSQWDDLKAIQIRNWNFKEETGHETHRQIGPIAQELEIVCPGLVFETPDRDKDGNETGEVTKGVNQSVLYMKAVKALQEAMERIEQLEQRLADAGI